ncbi:hypothetical protein ACOMHN_016145 [Nucella lapillus]
MGRPRKTTESGAKTSASQEAKDGSSLSSFYRYLPSFSGIASPSRSSISLVKKKPRRRKAHKSSSKKVTPENSTSNNSVGKRAGQEVRKAPRKARHEHKTLTVRESGRFRLGQRALHAAEATIRKDGLSGSKSAARGRPPTRHHGEHEEREERGRKPRRRDDEVLCHICRGLASRTRTCKSVSGGSVTSRSSGTEKVRKRGRPRKNAAPTED